jgi:hypothetical protein
MPLFLQRSIFPLLNNSVRTIAICLALIPCGLSHFAEAAVVQPGKVFVSPDKSKSVRLLYYDREYRYAVTDEKSGKTTTLEAEYAPVFAVAWSLDSRSIFILAHVARGSLVQILHLGKNGWNKYTIDVPEPQSHESTVIDWNIRPTLLTLVCKVGLQKANGEFYACYEGTFNVDPLSGATSNLRKRQLTAEDCLKVKSKFEPE